MNTIEKIFPPNDCKESCHEEHRTVLAEYFCALAIPNMLWKKCMDASQLKELTSIVEDCLKFNCKERVKSSSLIHRSFFKDCS